MKRKFWITFLLFGLPFTIFTAVGNSILQDGLNAAIFVSALIAGILFGLSCAWTSQYSVEKLLKKIPIETEDDENVIREGAANHFKGIEGVGGKLVLTNKRLIFRSHKLNIQNHQESFYLEQVEELQATKTFKLLENGLTLQLTNNRSHKFIVDEPTNWIKEK